MEKQYEKLLDSLYGFEGGKLHYNGKDVIPSAKLSMYFHNSALGCWNL